MPPLQGRSLGRGLGVGLLLLALPISAQSPKSLKQVKKAVYTLQTYDAEGNELSTGNGFFANEAGDFITSYALLPSCAKAVVIDSKGKTHEVVKVLGANETYDIVRLQTVPIKKLVSTPIDTTSTMEHTSLFLPAIGRDPRTVCRSFLHDPHARQFQPQPQSCQLCGDRSL